jgi:hypothetical protein
MTAGEQKMIFQCIFSHEFGLPRLDENGVLRKQCMKCGRTVASRAKLAPETALVESLNAQRDLALTILGDRWVGRPSNDQPEQVPEVAEAPAPEKPALHVVHGADEAPATQAGGKHRAA